VNVFAASPSTRLTLAIVLCIGIAVGLAADYASRREVDLALAVSQARVDALQRDLDRALGRHTPPVPVAATSGHAVPATDVAQFAAGVAERVKDELRTEYGWMPAKMLRARRESFVELYATDADAHESYGTAGHLGGGYFVTVKHGVMSLTSEQAPIQHVRLRINGRLVDARVVDAGNAQREVHTGDWAIVKAAVPVDLPALSLDLDYAFAFGDSIIRLGNDYSQGIVAASGFVGQRANGLVTCLTDGHPGASGGGVLDSNGHLVGIPVGRLQGDYRFSFILPIRREMLRKVPHLREPTTPVAPTASNPAP